MLTEPTAAMVQQSTQKIFNYLLCGKKQDMIVHLQYVIYVHKCVYIPYVHI